MTTKIIAGLLALYCILSIAYETLSNDAAQNLPVTGDIQSSLVIKGIFLFIAICVLIFSRPQSNSNPSSNDDDSKT